MTVGGRQRMGGGDRIAVVEPHNHRRVLGHLGNATDDDVAAVIEAAAGARPAGGRCPSIDLPSGAIGAIRRVTAHAHWAFRVNIGRPTLNPERSGELQGRPNLDLVA